MKDLGCSGEFLRSFEHRGPFLLCVSPKPVVSIFPHANEALWISLVLFKIRSDDKRVGQSETL